MQKGIYTLKDITGPKHMLSFQELCEWYGMNIFAPKVGHGGLWRCPGVKLFPHTIIAWFVLSSSSHFSSWMYGKVLEATANRLAIQHAWERDCE